MNLLQDSATRPKEEAVAEKPVVTRSSKPPERKDIPLLPPGLGLEKVTIVLFLSAPLELTTSLRNIDHSCVTAAAT